MQHITNWVFPTGTEGCEGRPWILCHFESKWSGVTMSPAGLSVDAAMKPVPAGMPIGHGVPGH